MKKNQKIALIAIILLVVIIAVYLLFFQAPSFEKEYERMSLAWKNNGLKEERLHASETVFSLDSEKIEDIRSEISSFSSSPNPAIKDLSTTYLLFLESAKIASEISSMSETLAGSQQGLCESLPAYERLGKKFSELEEKKEAYLKATNAFVSKYPKEAESISLKANTAGLQGASSSKFVELLEVAKEVCS
ncbi:MAG: hypothetical protein QXK06_05735 [Candidatus Diapherotrites archaeon]